MIFFVSVLQTRAPVNSLHVWGFRCFRPISYVTENKKGYMSECCCNSLYSIWIIILSIITTLYFCAFFIFISDKSRRPCLVVGRVSACRLFLFLSTHVQKQAPGHRNHDHRRRYACKGVKRAPEGRKPGFQATKKPGSTRLSPFPCGVA